MRVHCFQQSLNRAIIEDLRSNKEKIMEAVLEVKMVQALSMMFYKGDELINFARISLALPRLIAAAKRLIERGADSFGLMDPAFYESNIDFDIR